MSHVSGQNWQPARPVLGVFGKHPEQGDFICLGESNSALHALDLWVQRGLDLAQRELHQDYIQTYDTAFFHCFIYRPDQGERTLAGIGCPSNDAFGRRFPLLVFAQVPASFADAHPALLPSFAGPLFSQLAETVYSGAKLRSLADISYRLEQFFWVEHSPADLAAAWQSGEARYRNFLQDTICGDLGAPGCLGPKLLGDLISVVGGTITDTRNLRVGIQVPLFHSAYARGLEIRFYIELCQALRNHPLTLSLAWRTGLPEPATSKLTLSFREPEGALFAALLGAARWAVWRPGTGNSFPLIGGWRRPEAAPTEETSLGELLATLSPQSL